MTMVGKYRLTSPTVALFVEFGRHVVVTVPAGAIVTLGSETIDDSKLVNATWENKRVMMLAKEVRTRGEEIH
jgi:hypothetical protein